MTGIAWACRTSQVSLGLESPRDIGEETAYRRLCHSMHSQAVDAGAKLREREPVSSTERQPAVINSQAQKLDICVEVGYEPLEGSGRPVPRHEHDRVVLLGLTGRHGKALLGCRSPCNHKPSPILIDQ